MDPFELEVDASGFAMGAILLQKKEDSKKHPIAYYSKTLSAAERNYDISLRPPKLTILKGTPQNQPSCCKGSTYALRI
jgi:hypothetical protein